jgi:hypothetical protein
MSEKSWLACLVAGIFLTVLGSTGIPQLGLVISDFDFKIVVTLIGLLLIAWAPILIWLERRPTTPQSSIPDRKTYSVVITEPKRTEALTGSITFKGTIKKKLPHGWELWLLNQGEQKGDKAFWPQDSVKFNGKDGKVTYRPKLSLPREHRTVRLYFVDQSGQALIATYKKINEHFADPKNDNWIGITLLTTDMKPATDLIHLSVLSG